MIKKYKYLFLLTITFSKLLISKNKDNEIAKLLVLTKKITTKDKSFENKSFENNILNNNSLVDIKLIKEYSKNTNQEIILPENFVLPENFQDTTNITKAGGNVTTANDFLAINKIVKTSNTGTAVTDSGITIDGSNNISGVNSITLPASTASTPSVIFPGSSTNTGFYSPSSDTIGISSQGSSIITFYPTGVNIASGKTLTANGSSVFNNSAQFNNTTTLNANATLNGTTTFASGTTISGSAVINGATNLATGVTFSGPTTISGSINLQNGGSASNPAITFNGQTNTGIYATNNNVCVSTEGAQRINFATGAVTIAVNNSLISPSGTASSPTIQFSGSTNTGLSAPTSNTISFDISGSEKANLSSSSLNMAVPINMNSNNINNANVISATGVTCTSTINATGVTVTGNATFNSGSSLNVSQMRFSRICPTQFTAAGNDTINLSTSSNSTNYDVFNIAGANVGYVTLIVGTGLPAGTLKMIINNATANPYFTGYSGAGAFANITGRPFASVYPTFIDCGHGSILMCTDSTNGYWAPMVTF